MTSRRGFLRAGPGPDGVADGQDLCGPAEGRRDIEAVFVKQPEHPGLAHYIIHPLTPRRWRRAHWRRRAATRPSHRTPRMRCTCPPTPSPESASGRIDRHQPVGSSRAAGDAREELHALDYLADVLPADRAGRRCPRMLVAIAPLAGDLDPARQHRAAAGDTLRPRPSLHGIRSSAATGPAAGWPAQEPPTPTRSPVSRARWAPHAAANRGRRCGHGLPCGAARQSRDARIPMDGAGRMQRHWQSRGHPRRGPPAEATSH